MPQVARRARRLSVWPVAAREALTGWGLRTPDLGDSLACGVQASSAFRKPKPAPTERRVWREHLRCVRICSALITRFQKA